MTIRTSELLAESIESKIIVVSCATLKMLDIRLGDKIVSSFSKEYDADYMVYPYPIMLYNMIKSSKFKDKIFWKEICEGFWMCAPCFNRNLDYDLISAQDGYDFVSPIVCGFSGNQLKPEVGKYIKHLNFLQKIASSSKSYHDLMYNSLFYAHSVKHLESLGLENSISTAQDGFEVRDFFPKSTSCYKCIELLTFIVGSTGMPGDILELYRLLIRNIGASCYDSKYSGSQDKAISFMEKLEANLSIIHERHGNSLISFFLFNMSVCNSRNFMNKVVSTILLISFFVLFEALKLEVKDSYKGDFRQIILDFDSMLNSQDISSILGENSEYLTTAKVSELII